MINYTTQIQLAFDEESKNVLLRFLSQSPFESRVEGFDFSINKEQIKFLVESLTEILKDKEDDSKP